jgi:hypothetical protein
MPPHCEINDKIQAWNLIPDEYFFYNLNRLVQDFSFFNLKRFLVVVSSI